MTSTAVLPDLATLHQADGVFRFNAVLGYGHDSNDDGRDIVIHILPALIRYGFLSVSTAEAFLVGREVPAAQEAMLAKLTAPSAKSELPRLMNGVYRHYKGHSYLVQGFGLDLDRPGRVVVVYVPIDSYPIRTGPRMAIRTVDDFFSSVQNGEPRFVYHGTGL